MLIIIASQRGDMRKIVKMKPAMKLHMMKLMFMIELEPAASTSPDNIAFAHASSPKQPIITLISGARPDRPL